MFSLTAVRQRHTIAEMTSPTSITIQNVPPFASLAIEGNPQRDFEKMMRFESEPGNLMVPGGFEGLKSGNGPNVKRLCQKKMMMTSTGMLRKVST